MYSFAGFVNPYAIERIGEDGLFGGEMAVLEPLWEKWKEQSAAMELASQQYVV